MTNNDRYRLALRQGETFSRQIKLYECDNSPFVLTGYSARMQVRPAPGGEVLFSVSTNDGADVSCTLTDAGDVVTSTAHYLAVGCPLQFTQVNTTTGIALNTTYYIISATSNTFTISATRGGTKLNFHNDGTGVYNTIGRGITVDGEAGTLDIEIGAACTEAYTPGMYYYDLLSESTSGVVSCILTGKFEVTTRITV